MVYKAIGFRVDFYQYHLSSHGKLEQMDKVIHRFIGVIYWLYLFISFIYSVWWLFSIGFIHWLYLFFGFIYSIWSLDLSIGFIYWLYLFIGFIYSIWWLYLPALSMGFSFSVYSIHTHSKLSFSHVSERNTLTLLSIFISHVPMVKIARLKLRHHRCLIKLTLLQLHHHTLLIKLTNIASLHHTPYTCPLIKLTNITSLHHSCYTCSIPTLQYSSIIPHCSGSTHLLIPLDIKLLHLSFIFIPFVKRPASFSISKYIWDTLKLLLLSGDVEINPGPQPIDQNPSILYHLRQKN